jgi:hypothetical protein
MTEVAAEQINQEAWAEWVEWRRTEKKKKVTPTAQKLQWRLLANYDHELQREIIERSIMNDWQGLFHHPNAPRQQRIEASGSTRSRTLSQDLNDREWAK